GARGWLRESHGDGRRLHDGAARAGNPAEKDGCPVRIVRRAGDGCVARPGITVDNESDHGACLSRSTRSDWEPMRIAGAVRALRFYGKEFAGGAAIHRAGWR